MEDKLQKTLNREDIDSMASWCNSFSAIESSDRTWTVSLNDTSVDLEATGESFTEALLNLAILIGK